MLPILIALVPVVSAEFDQCARPSGVWAGYDQGYGRSRGYAVTYNGGNVYVAGYAIGNLSFHSMHSDDTYADHEGTGLVHDSYTDVTVHHDAGTFTDPNYYKDPAGTQHGMDSTIYKINAAGVPQSVFAANTETFDGVYGDGSSINGAWSGYSQFNALDGFDAEGDMIAGAGYFRGNLSFPMNDGSTKTLSHTHQGSNYYGFVCKVDMAANRAMWVTDVGMRDNFVYVRSAATTAAGHVLVSGNIKNGAGFINLYDGADGTSMWSKSPVSDTSMISSVDAVDEIAYVSGLFSGSAVDLLESNSLLTSSSSGSGKDAFVAALDVGSGSGSPMWVVQIGGSSGYPSVTVSGDYVYVAGALSTASNISTCSLTAARGGYLAKLARADGACAWAKDVPASRHVVSDGTHIWTVQTSTSKLMFDDEHVLDNIGIEKDVFMAKYQSSDGAGLWATVIGGTGDEEGDAATITPSGPIFTGSSQSEAISVGDLTIRNLHHQQAEARAGFDPETSHAQNAGQRALYVVMVAATDVMPSCISSCPSGKLSDATITAGHCYANGVCVADDAYSDAHFPAMSCLRCDAATNQLALSAPDTTNHCYFDDICHPRGERATGTNWRNEASVCEWCDPTVNIGGYTLRAGYAHHETIAKTHFGAVSFGMVFGDWANGCQLLPDVTLPTNKQSALTTALVNPTSAAVTDIGGRTSNAITAVKVSTNTLNSANQGIEEAYAWYHADAATCTTVSSGTCSHTPAELADTLGGAFGTTTTNGISISRIKVQQGLVLLQEQYDPDAPSAIVASLTVDVVAHMLIPYYQGAIHSAHDIDMATDNAQRSVAKARGAAYLKVIDDELNNASFSAADRASLSAIFSDDFTMTSSHYCAVRDRLLRNLPAVSTLQYREERPAGSHATGTLVASATSNGGIVHLSSEDVGALTAAAGVVCPPASRYPLTYTDCGVSHTIAKAPMKVVTMNQGVTEFMLAMGLQDHMAGTAYLDDSIWPRYAKEYNAIPVLSSSYPTDAQIMAVNADFIMANYNSAFSEKPRSNTSDSGVWTNATVGPCEGENSDFFPAGSNETMDYGRCRPQLHAINIGTWQERTYCEDTALRPATATEDTVYEAVAQLGDIFDVPHVATQLISEIRNDFALAKQTVQSTGHALTAILVDGVECKVDGVKKPNTLFVGAGKGSVNLIMQAAGFTNKFANKEGSYACVDASEVIAANPDVLIIIEASWDSALNKIDYMHNHSDFCETKFVKQADYIKIPFSASALGPRNGAAALDLVSAAIHVTTGATTMNFESGVEIFDPNVLVDKTANLKCPLALTDIAYSGVASLPPQPVSTDDDELPDWGIAIIVIALVLFFAVLLFAIMMYRAEKSGKPIFSSLTDVQVANAKPQA